MAADVLLQCTGIIDIFRLLPATHVIMVANAVYTVALILYEARKEGNDEAKKFQYPMCVLIVFGMVEMFLYYLRKFQQTSILLPIGTLLFIIMLIWIQFPILRSIHPETKGDLSAENSQHGYAHRGHEPKCLRGYGEISG